MPKGLKPVRRKLADGRVRVYWYHRATGKALEHDPASAAGLLEVQALDLKAKALATAQKAATGSLAALWTAYRGDPASPDPDIRLGSPEWRTLKPRTRSDYQKVRDWLGPAAEQAMVARVTSAQVIALRDKAFKQRGLRFANYVVAVLRLLFAWGKLRDWCLSNPAKGVPAIRKSRGARKVNRAWAPDEVAAFAAAAPTHVLVPFALGLFAGMRQGDALIVTWSAIVAGRLDWIAGKNGEECSAPVTGPLALVLAEARAKRGDALQIAVNSRGAPWTASGYRAVFFKLVRELTKHGDLRPGCTFHGLRHTIGAQAANDGASERQIAAGIGDRSPAMAQIYARDAERTKAQLSILEAAQKRFANIEWKTGLENVPARKPSKKGKR